MSDLSPSADAQSVAVIGLACRFPDAANPDEFWANLAQGHEAMRDLDEAELRASGVPERLLNDPRHVRRASRVDKVEHFDAAFFDFTPREATLTAPSQRLLLQCAHEAFEDAGYDPARCNPNVGVFAGVNRCDHWQRGLYDLADGDSGGSARRLQLSIANDLDFAAPRVSHKLNLKGPSVNVSTACSTSLVAIHQACRSLLAYECDMALAGGASVELPQQSGYLHEPGGLLSDDGRCRAFDARSSGTIGGNGAGMVLLKRLDEAVADRDHVHAIIRGSALNNDGAAKVGFTAPGVQGQSQAVLAALELAGIDPADVTYVEANGTGTRLGDPIEVEALTRAFRARTRRRQYCALGSVKSNIGHLGAAAGMAGFIKVVLALKHRQLPPSLHFEAANPEIDFESSPFFVNTALTPWQGSPSGQRIAGVSAFGVGGTNAHVVLEEAGPPAQTGPSREAQVLAVSARTPAALQALCHRLADRLESDAGLALADVAYTLHVGRAARPCRHAVLAATRDEAIRRLRQASQAAAFQRADAAAPGLAFMFPGPGSPCAGMARGLYEGEPVFREVLDRCSQWLEPLLVRDLRALLFPRHGHEAEAQRLLHRGEIAHPALFAVEYALACQLEAWGLRAAAMIGQGLGEYVAACLAGVFSLEEALRLVLAHGRLVQSMAGERMPAAGLDEFSRTVRGVALAAPRRRFISHLTGTWIEAHEATDPDYWVSQLRAPARFQSGISTLRASGVSVLLEVGPGQALAQAVQAVLEPGQACTVAATCRPPQDMGPDDDRQVLLGALAAAWQAGVEVDWGAFHRDERRARVPLPTYPFEGQCYGLQQLRSLAREAPAASATPEPGSDGMAGPMAEALAGISRADPVQRASLLLALVGERVQALLGVPEAVDVDIPLVELGLDSLMGLELRTELNAILHANPLSVMFLMDETTTLRALAMHLERSLAGEAPPAMDKPRLPAFSDRDTAELLARSH